MTKIEKLYQCIQNWAEEDIENRGSIVITAQVGEENHARITQQLSGRSSVLIQTLAAAMDKDDNFRRLIMAASALLMKKAVADGKE